MGSRQAGKDEAASKDQQSQPQHRRAPSLNDAYQRKTVLKQDDKKDGSSNLATPAQPRRRGRSADAGTGRNEGGLSPVGEPAARRKSNENHRPKIKVGEKPAIVIQPPDRHGTPKLKAGAGIEERKNLTRHDLRRAVTRASGMLKENNENAGRAADMIMEALLWDGIKKLSRSDRDIILAKEHLIGCFFAVGDLRRAESFSREVLAARESTKPPDPIRTRDARQKLIQALLEIAVCHRNEKNWRKAAQLNNEGLALAIKNMETEGNLRAGDDALDVLHFCSELLERKSNSPGERTRLLKIKVRALQKAYGNKTFEDLKAITLERLKLSRIYISELNNRKRGDEVYADLKSDIRAFRRVDPGHSEATLGLSDEAGWVWKSMLGQVAQARWTKCLTEVRSRVRRALPQKREIRQKWYLLSRRLLARQRWQVVLRRIRRRAKRRITERRAEVIAKWCGLTRQVLEQVKMEKKSLEEEKERKIAAELKKKKEEEDARKDAEQERIEEEKKREDKTRKDEKIKLEKSRAAEEKRRAKEEEDRRFIQQKHEEEKKRQAVEFANRNRFNDGVEQGVSRIGTGLSEMSEAETIPPGDADAGPVLFDARPESASSNNTLSEKWIKDFIKFRKSILPGKFDENAMERIRLTIIDTGVDATHPYIKKRWQRYRTGTRIPLFKDFDNAVESPIDEDGHGTFIAGLVLRLAPDVEVSVARVCRNQSSMNKDHNRETKVAEAVSHAIEKWETDIISMSIGYETDMTGEIRSAVSNVQQTNRVVMFCAAGNFGNTRANISLPARADGVFKMFACDHTGYASTMNPQPSSNPDYSFSILGCNIESTWPMSLKEAGEESGLKMTEKPKNAGLWTTMSGTSFATPIAAALVAITYQFHDENTVRMNLPPGIEMKRPETVKAVLLRMSLPPGVNGYNTLTPTVGRRNFFKFHPGRGKPMVSFFADRLSDILWEQY